MVRKISVKQNPPLVSVLMPAYNAQSYIAESIQSILNQTYTNIEFIIIDDHSSDETWGIIQRFAKIDKRIKALRNSRNVYIAANRNKLIALAKGKYIAWQDADDKATATRLEKQCRFLEAHPEVGIVGGFLQFFNDRGSTGIRKYASDDKSIRKKIFRYSPVAQPTAMIRRICFNELGKYDVNYPPAEDIDMSFRIGTKYKFANLQEITLYYRESSSSATYKRVKFILNTTITIRRKYWHRKEYTPTFTDHILNYLQRIMLYVLPAKTIILLFNLTRNS